MFVLHYQQFPNKKSFQTKAHLFIFIYPYKHFLRIFVPVELTDWQQHNSVMISRCKYVLLINVQSNYPSLRSFDQEPHLEKNYCSSRYFICEAKITSDCRRDFCLDKTSPVVRKPVSRGFRPGPTQIGLYSSRRWLEA